MSRTTMGLTLEPPFIWQWTIATAIGCAISGALIPTPIGPSVFVLWSVFVGLGQWSVLRRVVPKAWKWLLATVIGGQIATVLFAILLPPLVIYATPSKLGGEVPPPAPIIILMAITLTAVSSLLLSTIQYLALRHYPRSKQWLWTGLVAATSAIGLIAATVWGLFDGGGSYGEFYGKFLVIGGVSGAVYGFLQGRVLAQIVNRR